MSQSTLDDLAGGADPEPDDESAGWRPTTDTTADAHRCCQNCGSHVTATFRRCLGDAENVAHHCSQCVESREMLLDGAAQDPEYDVSDLSERRTIAIGRFGNGRGV